VSVDIAHLTFRPPFVSGSYNRLVAEQIAGLTEFSQVALSFWEGMLPSKEAANEAFLVVNESELSPLRRAYLKAPERLHQFTHNGIGSRQALAYLWGVQRHLAKLKPKIVICYDGYKYGPLLRRTITWPCRLILAQRGFSYKLSPREAHKVYSLESFDVVWVLSFAAYRHDRRSLTDYGPAVAVVPNGVDIERFSPPTEDERRKCREQWKLPQDALIVLMLNRLVPKKGVHLAVQSWHRIVSRFPNAFLWIVGDGPGDYRRHLEQIVTATGVTDSVRFQGSVAHENTPSCFRAADMYLFPTLASEGMANSLMQAMACGLPCISSDDPSALEHFGDAVLFVHDVNVEGQLIGPLLSLAANEECRRHWGALARRRVEERFNAESILSTLGGFFAQQLRYVS
jgi:Glycosyltransferase